MMKLLIAFLLFTISELQSQDLKAYQLFTSKGKKITYGKMIKEIADFDIIFFGEQHNAPIAHWLELEVLKSLDKDSELVLGMEMFERDIQPVISNYLLDSLDEKTFEDTSRVWSNYRTDYSPLIQYAKTNHIPVVGTNIPRRYARMVHYYGLDTLQHLTSEELSWVAPLPLEVDTSLTVYKMMRTMMGHHGANNLIYAQAIKDATMAFSISQHIGEGKQFLHINGSFHSDHHEGIVWYLKKYAPSLTVVTIGTVTQENITELSTEYLGKADYILCIDADMTTSY